MGIFTKTKKQSQTEVSAENESTIDTFLSRTLRGAKTLVNTIAPFTVIGTAKSVNSMLSDVVAEKIKSEATIKAYELLSDTHRQVTTTIVWQNVLLMASLMPVYWLNSPYPFYLAYACVVAYSARSIYRCRAIILLWFRTKSLHATLQCSILDAMRTEVAQRPFYERAYMEYLGPDLDHVASSVADKLAPDIKHALLNMALTLGMAFVAFRLFAIPLLEHRALT